MQVFDDGVHEWTKKKETAGDERNRRQQIQSRKVLICSCWWCPICQKMFQVGSSSSTRPAISTYSAYIYKSLSESFEANSFPISWQKGFALYVEIYIYRPLRVCLSAYSVCIQIHIRGCRLSSRSKRSKDLDVFSSFLFNPFDSSNDELRPI